MADQSPSRAAEPASIAPATATTSAPAPQAPASPPAAPDDTLLPADHWTRLHAQGEDEDDADSAFGSQAESSTASLSSSILDYRTKYGRTFHAERGNVEYWASNDEQQNISQDINHHALLLVLDDKLYLAPLEKNIQTVLDVGTGTGIWVMDFADEFPSAEVLGMDISPIQPQWVSPNVKFEIDDFNLEWTYKLNSIDYVHLRYLFGSVTDWDALMRNSYDVCKPGGWVESYEPSTVVKSDDGSLTPESALSEWHKFFIEGGKKMGRSCSIVEDDTQYQSMKKAGFVDIQVQDFKVPIGAWPKDPKQRNIGSYLKASLEQDLDGYMMYMAQEHLGWSDLEVKVYCAQLRRELRAGHQHSYFRQRAVWGRKP